MCVSGVGWGWGWSCEQTLSSFMVKFYKVFQVRLWFPINIPYGPNHITGHVWSNKLVQRTLHWGPSFGYFSDMERWTVVLGTRRIWEHILLSCAKRSYLAAWNSDVQQVKGVICVRIATVFSKLRGKNERKYSLKSLACHDEVFMVQTANIGQYRSFKRYRSSNGFTFHTQLVIFVIVTTDLSL